MTIIELSERGRPRQLVAAAMSLAEGVNSPELIKQLKRHEAWQMDASGYFSEIGEIHYVVNRAAAALSEARLYAATSSEQGGPVPVDAPESAVGESVAALANAVVAEFRSPVGGQEQLVHQAFVNVEIAGEFFLIETEDDTGVPGWWVRSVLETKINDPDKPVEIKGVGEVPFDNVSRVWRPHPMRFEAADSGMRPILGACELVLLIDRHFRASMRSRLFAGLLLLPNSFRKGAPDRSQEGDPTADPVVQDILDALSTSIADEGSPSAVVPNAIYGATDEIKAVTRVEFAQRVDPETLKLRDASITRIVQGLEYPPEVVTGTGDVSHWGAWFIGDSFIDHIRPKGDFLADAFTTVFLRPSLEAAGVSAEDAAKVFLAFDYAPLARKPNIVETATLAYDRFVISEASMRRDLGYDDDDAPDEKELAARIARTPTAINKQGVPGSPLPQAGVTTGPPAGGPETVAASAASNSVGGQLARLDVELVDKLFGATVQAMRRAVEKAGNRAKSRVASAHREAVRTVDPSEVCAQLGPTLLAAAGLTEDELLAGGLSELEKDYRRWAFAAGAAAFALAVGDAVLDDAVVAAWEAQLLANIDQSWLWFSDALNKSLSRHIASGGNPVDSELRALIRQAVAAAGGVTELTLGTTGTVPVSAVTGIGTGPITLDMLALAGKEVAGWRWVHDSPAHPFPPHVALDGAEASTADEFGIDFGDWPGSHAGCLCQLEPLVRRADD